MHRACMFEHVHSLTYVWVFVCLHVDTVCVGVGDGWCLVSGVHAAWYSRTTELEASKRPPPGSSGHTHGPAVRFTTRLPGLRNHAGQHSVSRSGRQPPCGTRVDQCLGKHRTTDRWLSCGPWHRCRQPRRCVDTFCTRPRRLSPALSLSQEGPFTFPAACAYLRRKPA